MIEFTTTAVNRPEVLDKTYSSFRKNLLGVDMSECTLNINIDPIPDGDRQGVIDVCNKYFKETRCNLPDEPNFTNAYSWIFSSARTDVIFNLEDDWQLIKPVDISPFIEMLRNNEELMEVALRAYVYDYETLPLSPSLMHRRYYGAIAGNLDSSKSPEIQLRGEKFGIVMPCKKSGIGPKGRLIVHPKKEIVLKDLGRNWIAGTKFSRPKRKCDFTTWVKQ